MSYLTANFLSAGVTGRYNYRVKLFSGKKKAGRCME